MIKKYLIAGLLLWVPIGITLWVLHFLVTSVDQLVEFLPIKWRSESLFGFHVFGFGLVVSFLALLATGILVRNFLGQRIVRWWDGILHRVPVVGGIYKSVKQISDTVLSDSGQAFNKALLIEFPHAGSWTVAFQTGAPGGEIKAKLPEDCVSVYVPTTPNPTSGYLVLVPKHKTRELDMSVDQALKYIISMGAVPVEAAPALVAENSNKRN